MNIDIIDLTDPQYRNLSAVQLAMVRIAQAKKDKILAKKAQDIIVIEQQFSINHTARTTALSFYKKEITDIADAEVAIVREDLLYQLAYEALGTEGNEKGPYRYPENPNYTLSYSQRFLVVRQYYMEITNDAAARLEAYRMDTLARSYLGEFYLTLYDLFASYVK